MVPILESVPNFSEGRDPGWVKELVEAISREGAEVLDWSSDPDHNRSVVTFVGDPRSVEQAALAAARFAFEHIDLRRHQGVHPRVGAVDVLPFIPLHALTIADATASAHRVGEELAQGGVPVYFYGSASESGRSLAQLRRGGFEALADGFPPGREPDLPCGELGRPHPAAGVTCVGARNLLLAWNVYVEGVELEALEVVAARLRERGGGFTALRALALELPLQGRRQISMNLEDLEVTSPVHVQRALEEHVERLGGRVTATEVVGMIPDGLVLPAAGDRLQLLDPNPSRLLSARLVEHISARLSRDVQALLDAIQAAGNGLPVAVRVQAERVARIVRETPIPG